MSRGPGKAIAGIITLIIGGTVYSVSQADLVSNFSAETGLSQSEAEAYIASIPEDELVSFDVIGEDFIAEGEIILDIASEIDCVTYFYDWESDTLSCPEGKSQLRQFAESEIALGEAYQVISSESATNEDISAVIYLIDRVNDNYGLEIINQLLEDSEIDESIKTNLYNKSLLQAALDSE
jgi:hypothetical protein